MIHPMHAAMLHRALTQRDVGVGGSGSGQLPGFGEPPNTGQGNTPYKQKGFSQKDFINWFTQQGGVAGPVKSWTPFEWDVYNAVKRAKSPLGRIAAAQPFIIAKQQGYYPGPDELQSDVAKRNAFLSKLFGMAPVYRGGA